MPAGFNPNGVSASPQPPFPLMEVGFLPRSRKGEVRGGGHRIAEDRDITTPTRLALELRYRSPLERKRTALFQGEEKNLRLA